MHDLIENLIDVIMPPSGPRVRTLEDMAKQIIEAINASGSYVVVPVKPTVDMIVNAENAQSSRWFAEQAGRTFPHKEHEVVIWDAMIAARPRE